MGKDRITYTKEVVYRNERCKHVIIANSIFRYADSISKTTMRINGSLILELHQDEKSIIYVRNSHILNSHICIFSSSDLLLSNIYNLKFDKFDSDEYMVYGDDIVDMPIIDF